MHALLPNALDPEAFRSFDVVSVTPVNHDTSRIRVALPEGTKWNLPVSSFVLVKADVGGKTVVRPYTPITLERDDTPYLDLLVKRYETGSMSKFLHSLKPGSKVEIKGPIEKLEMTPGRFSILNMVAGGTGITPMYQIIRETLSRPQEKDPVVIRVIYSVHNLRDVLLMPELRALEEKHYPRLQERYCLSQPPMPGEQVYVPNSFRSRVTKRILEGFFSPPGTNQQKVLVCGPPGFMEAISGSKAPDYSQGELSGMLQELGYSKDEVYKL